MLTSKLPTYSDWQSEWFQARWDESKICQSNWFHIREKVPGQGLPILHRKEWEIFYAIQTIYEKGLLLPGKRGICFAVGQEITPCLLANVYGCEILGTDLQSTMWNVKPESAALEQFFYPDVCSKETFDHLVSYKEVNMKNIPPELYGQFDFCWSLCAFEHLGSLEAGLDFVANSVKVLKPGGVAVHTGEYNLDSNEETVLEPDCVAYRKRDIEEFTLRCMKEGLNLRPFDSTSGTQEKDKVVDCSTWNLGDHLINYKNRKWAMTSLGLILDR